ncbi:hypothetical protein [Bosea sp. BIWAKO-01]|uniref:hypothetical protein n=1 Tax=Bosea sp. BIWAKO-01 TaxID=506668 RepID=UPI000852E585|nr:hypothetical protein [Bosea sp. BIWAKO-01]GAU85176.1 hypothetical protein BIWAKO_05120 [Bosea sp. BIWAKO-01]
MIRKFTIDPARVEKLTSRRAALFEVARNDEADRNEKIAALGRLEAEHARSRQAIRRWVAPPSEVEKIAKLKAEIADGKRRFEASIAGAQQYAKLADAVTTYALPRPATFGGAIVKGFSNGR